MSAYMFSIPITQPCKSGFHLSLYVQYTLRMHSNIYLCPTIPNFTDLICSVQPETSHQKVAFIRSYMCSIHRNLEQLPCSTLVLIINWPYMFSSPKTLQSKSCFQLTLYGSVSSGRELALSYVLFKKKFVNLLWPNVKSNTLFSQLFMSDLNFFPSNEAKKNLL